MLENGTGAVGGNSQNIPTAQIPRTYSSFDLKAHRFNTERFGEYTPIIAFESVKEDKLPVRLAHQLRSYTMSSPLMQDITKVKELFAVPMESILPLNWEKFYDNPVRGDDVPVDVGPTIESFWSKVSALMSVVRSQFISIINNNTTTEAQAITALFRYFILHEYFYSDGSLMSVLGYHGAPYLRIFASGNFSYLTQNKYYTFDEVEDLVFSVLSSEVTSMDVVIDGVTYYYRKVQSQDGYSDIYVPLRHIINLLRDDPTGYVSSVSFNSTTYPNYMADIFGAITDNSVLSWTYNNSTTPFNTQFISAYQICCAHYYSNDHVDYVYSAELFRQLIGHYLTYFSGYNPYFTRNGIKYQYDYLSAHAFSYILTAVAGSSSTVADILKVSTGTTAAANTARAVLGYFSALLAFRRSLKYLDYFTGSRTSPLAVGSVNVNVTGTTVNVIDITRNIQKQRFLNSINRIGHKFENYLKGLFGGSMPAPDYHNPFNLAKTVDSVFGDETNNTGAAQVSISNPVAITTDLKARSNDYMFEIQSDRPCVIIAITYYDIPRVHLFSADRSFFHVDRFDYFNPFFQYTGDQPVYQQELGIQPISTTNFANFGYSLRHMEYKQLYSSCAGGFVKALPGWIFPAVDRRGNSYVLSPEWIRSVQSEFDNFYKSLTGWSLATYFHFIVDNFVDFSGQRPMAFAPQILG